MYGIQDTVYKNLLEYFNEHVNIKQVILFGSRAKDTANLNSDIDLCITYKSNAKVTIKDDIDKIVGIYSCDIVFADQLSKELERQIVRDGIVIYKKND